MSISSLIPPNYPVWQRIWTSTVLRMTPSLRELPRSTHLIIQRRMSSTSPLSLLWRRSSNLDLSILGKGGVAFAHPTKEDVVNVVPMEESSIGVPLVVRQPWAPQERAENCGEVFYGQFLGRKGLGEVDEGDPYQQHLTGSHLSSTLFLFQKVARKSELCQAITNGVGFSLSVPGDMMDTSMVRFHGSSSQTWMSILISTQWRLSK